MENMALDPMIESMVNEYKKRVEEANALATQIQNSNTDFEQVLNNVQDEFETDEISSIQTQIQELEEQLTEIYKVEATRIVNEAQANSEDLTAVRAKFSTLSKAVSGLRDFLTNTGGLSADDLPKLKGTKAGRGGSSAQSGTFRIRGYNWNYDGNTYPNLSQAAKLADLDVKEIGSFLTRIHGEDRKNWPDTLVVELNSKKIEATKKAEEEESAA